MKSRWGLVSLNTLAYPFCQKVQLDLYSLNGILDLDTGASAVASR